MSMTRTAFEAIREAIVSGALELGEQLSEVQIADALGMSKAPVRAAFMELKEVGLVSVVPQSGTYVFSPGSDDVSVMSEFRALLENEALRKSVRRNHEGVVLGLRQTIAVMARAVADEHWSEYRRADSAFHSVLLDQSGNSYLPKAYALTSSALEALRVRLQEGTGGFRRQSFDEHKAILAHIEADRIDDAADLLRQHIVIINEFLHTFPPRRTRGRGADKDYGRIFSSA